MTYLALKAASTLSPNPLEDGGGLRLY